MPLATVPSPSAAERKTVLIDRMGGFEKHIEEALRNMEASVQFVDEQQHPDLKILLDKQFTSVFTETLYQKQTGRTGGMVIKAVDVRTGKELVSHLMGLPGNEESRRRDADSFAKKLNGKLSSNV